MAKRNLLGNLILLSAAVIWGGSFSFQRASSAVTPPFTFSACRLSLAAIALLIVSAVMTKTGIGGYKDRKIGKELLLGGVVCGIGLTAGTVFQQMGISTVTAGMSAFLTATYAVLTPIFALVFFKRKVPGPAWVGAVLATVGLYCLTGCEGFSGFGKGEVLSLLAAVGFTFQILSIERFLKDNNPVTLSAIQFTVTAIISWILAFIFEDVSLAVIIPSIPSMLYVGLLSGATGFTLQIIGQGMTVAPVAAVICSMESVFGAVFGAIFLHERMNSIELIGATLMFAAVIIVQLPGGKKNVRE